MSTPKGWTAVCTVEQLVPERGVAVLVGDQQVALFLVTGETGSFVHAVGHRRFNASSPLNLATSTAPPATEKTAVRYSGEYATA